MLAGKGNMEGFRVRIKKVLMPKYFSKVFHPQPPREPGHGEKSVKNIFAEDHSWEESE